MFSLNHLTQHVCVASDGLLTLSGVLSCLSPALMGSSTPHNPDQESEAFNTLLMTLIKLMTSMTFNIIKLTF